MVSAVAVKPGRVPAMGRTRPGSTREAAYCATTAFDLGDAGLKPDELRATITNRYMPAVSVIDLDLADGPVTGEITALSTVALAAEELIRSAVIW